MVEIRKDIKDILGRLRPATVGTGSPTTLTDLGLSISQVLGASAWAERHAKILASQAAGVPAYRTEEIAFNYVGDKFKPDDAMEEADKSTPDDAMEERIKQCAYENGINRRKVLDVLAIELRDALLARDL